LMVAGFANEVLEKIPHPEIKKILHTYFTEKLKRLMS
jgi:hypothetical protein